jgi:hypothetical protein
MFQFSGFAFWFASECHAFSMTGYPIRKPTDRKDICSSPWLIAACHVLLRLWEPRHPPYALIYFLLYYKLINISLFPTCQRTSSTQLNRLTLRKYTITIVSLLDPSSRSSWANSLFLRIQWTSFFFLFLISSFLWRIRESNPWPLACKANALANWANPPSSLRNYFWPIARPFRIIFMLEFHKSLVVPRRVELRTPTLSV